MGVEFILKKRPAQAHELQAIICEMPDLLLKYPAWLQRIAYNDQYLFAFINAITADNYELKYSDYAPYCTEEYFDLAVMANNQLEAVNLMLSWGANLYSAWHAAVQFNSLVIMRQLPLLFSYFEIGQLIYYGLTSIKNFEAVALINNIYPDAGLLLYTCRVAKL